MIKRIGIALLSLVYLFSTMGTVISMHYCMGRMVRVQWEAFGTGHTSCGMSPACCKDEYRVFKLGDVHQPASVHLFVLPSPALPSIPFALTASFPEGRLRPAAVAHAPPIDGCAPLYLLHSHFRI
jgi:hypothetical protein